GVLLDRIHELFHGPDKSWEPSLALEGVGHAITEHHHGGFQLGDRIGQLLEPEFGRFVVVESNAGLALRRVGTPSKVAEGNVALREAGREREFTKPYACSRSIKVSPTSTTRSPSRSSNGV